MWAVLKNDLHIFVRTLILAPEEHDRQTRAAAMSPRRNAVVARSLVTRQSGTESQFESKNDLTKIWY